MSGRDMSIGGSPVDPAGLFRDSPCLVSVHNRELTIIASNDAFEETFGPIAGRHCHEVYAGRQVRCDDCPVEATWADGQERSTERAVRLPDGRVVPVMAYTSPVLAPDGSIAAVMQTLADITPAKELERRLRSSRERLAHLFSEVPCYISVQDRELRIVRANRKFDEDFGERLGEHCYEVYKRRAEPCIGCPVEATFDDGETHQSEEVVIARDGTRTHTLVSTAPIYDSTGQVAHVMEMSTNVTRIRELEGQLTNLGMLVGSISHGLRGLLTGLDGGMYLLQTGLDNTKPERVEQGRRIIRRNVEHIRSVVRDLLRFAGEGEPTFRVGSIHDVAMSAAGRLSKRASDLQIDFRLTLDEGVGLGEIDRKALLESLNNILDDCFEACRVDTRKATHFVRFELRREAGHAVFEIEHNGVGMEPEVRERMFSLSFSSPGSVGSGLGLFTANKVIEEHRGTLEVSSEPRRGTTYAIRIPLIGEL